LNVFALPKASSKGLESSTYYSILAYTLICLPLELDLERSKSSSGPLKPLHALAKYESIILVASVLPAPDSPVIITD